MNDTTHTNKSGNDHPQTEATESILPTTVSATGGTGGAGGQAINLSYVDNYSTLLLVYTFLLNIVNRPGVNVNENTESELNLLLPILQSAMEEQKKYQEAFLQAITNITRPSNQSSA